MRCASRSGRRTRPAGDRTRRADDLDTRQLEVESVPAPAEDDLSWGNQDLKKTCTRCGETLPAIEFARNRTRSDGLQSWCRRCCKSYQDAHPKTRKGKAPDPGLSGRKPSSRAMRRPTRGRPVQGTSAEGTIVAMLKHTLWPMKLIAHIARVSAKTVYAIARSHGLSPRPHVSVRTVRAVDQVPANSRLWDRLLSLSVAKGGNLDAEDVRDAVKKCWERRDIATQRARKSKRDRLKGRKRGAKNRRRHYVNEPLTRHQLLLVGLILMFDPPDWLPKGEPRKRVSSRPPGFRQSGSTVIV